MVEPAGSPQEREARRLAGRIVAAVTAASAPRDDQLTGRTEPARPQARPSAPFVPSGLSPQEAVTAFVAGQREDGTPLPATQRAVFEEAFGRNLSTVRVHRGPQAARAAGAIGARAFSFGDHVVLGARANVLTGRAELSLLAHELAHVVQADAQGPPGPIRIRRDDGDVAVQEATEAAPPQEEEAPDRALDVARAQSLNLLWWETLELADVAPLGDVRPDQQPITYANRTLELQRLSRTAVYRGFVPGRALTLDGILGPHTFLFLYTLARTPNVPEGDKEPLRALGVDFEAVEEAHASAARALAVRDRPALAARWSLRLPAEQALRYYRRQYAMNRRDATLLDQVVFGGPAPEGITREDRLELLARLFGGGELSGVAALITVNRRFVHDFDAQFVVTRPPRPPGGWQVYFAFRVMDAAAFDDAVASLSLRVPSTRRARAVREELAARPGPGGEVPMPALLVAFDLPAPDEATRRAVVDTYVADKRIREEQRREEVEAHNRMAAGQRADRFIALAQERRDLRFTLRLQELLREFVGHDPTFFEYFLDDLRGRPTDWFAGLFDAVEGTRNFPAHALLLRLTLATRYADDERVGRSIDLINTRRQGSLQNAYLPDRVELGGPDGRPLRVGEVAGDKSSLYLRDEVVDRVKPDRMEALMEVAKDEAKQLFAAILRGDETRDLRDEDLACIALERAVENLPLTEEDMQRDVTYEESAQLLGIEQREENGVVRTYVTWQLVERHGGSGDWTPILNTRQTGDDRAFDFRLWLYKFSQMADVVETAALVVTFAAVAAVAWEAGLVSWLLSLGGGTVPVLLSIGISQIIYVLTAQTLTLEGFLFAALDGYLGAVAFRAFSPLGRGIAGRVGTESMRRLVAGWLLGRATVGGLSGALTLPAGRFARDLVAVLSGDRRQFSSLAEYLRDMALGFAFGVVFEIAGGALQPVFLSAGRTTLANLADVVQVLRTEGISPAQWTAHATGALSRMRAWAVANFQDDIARTLYGGFRERFRTVTEAYTRQARAVLMREVFDLAEIEISREASHGLERLLRSTTGRMSDDEVIAVLHRLRDVPERVDPFLRLTKDIQTTVLDDIIDARRLGSLADAPDVLRLSSRTSPADTGALLRDSFGGRVDDLDAFARRLFDLDERVQGDVLRLLRERPASVTPEALLALGRAGVDLSPDVVAGMGRLVGHPRLDRAGFETLLGALPGPRADEFLRHVQQAPAAELGPLVSVASDGPRGARLLTYVDDTPQLQRLLGNAGGSLEQLDDVFTASLAVRRDPAGLEALATGAGTFADVRAWVPLAGGDVAILNRSLTRLGGAANLRTVMSAADTASMDAPSLRRLLTEADARAWNDPPALTRFVESVPRARTDGSPTATWEEAMDALVWFADHHAGPPTVGTSTTALARPDAFVDLALPTQGSTLRVEITQFDWDHYLHRHTWEHLRFTPAKDAITPVPHRSLWSQGTAPSSILDDALAAARHPDVARAVEANLAAGGFAQAQGVTVGGRVHTIGVDVALRRITQFYPTNADVLPRRVLQGIKNVLGL